MQGSAPKQLLLADQQEAAAGVATAGADDADFGRGCDLALAGLAPHLRSAFVQEAVAVQPSCRQLAAVRVERELPLARDVLAAVDERAAPADLAQVQRFHPRHR